MKRMVINIRITNFCKFTCHNCFVTEHSYDTRFIDHNKITSFFDKIITEKYKVIVIAMYGGELAHLPIEVTKEYYDALNEYFEGKDQDVYFKIITRGDFDNLDEWFDLYKRIVDRNNTISDNSEFKRIIPFGPVTISPETLTENSIKMIKNMRQVFGKTMLRFIYTKPEDIEVLEELLDKLDLEYMFELDVTRLYDFSKEPFVVHNIDTPIFKEISTMVAKKGGLAFQSSHMRGNKCKYDESKIFLTIHSTGHISPCPLAIDDIEKNKYIHDYNLFPLPHIDNVECMDDIIKSPLYQWWYKLLAKHKDTFGCPLLLEYEGSN